jgi:MFS family permease
VKVTHVVLGVALLMAASALFHLMTEPFLATGKFTQYKLWWLIGSAFGSVVGGFIVGILVWPSIKNTVCGRFVRDRQTCGLYGASLSVAVLIVIGLVVSPMSAEERRVFIAGVEKTCFPAQRSAPVNVTLTDEKLRKYCRCIAESLGGRITKKEVRYFWENKSMPLSAQSKATETALECRQKLIAN